MLKGVWEWLVAHVPWTGAAVATLFLFFRGDIDAASNWLVFVIFALLLVLVWVPAWARMRRIFLQHYHRA